MDYHHMFSKLAKTEYFKTLQYVRCRQSHSVRSTFPFHSLHYTDLCSYQPVIFNDVWNECKKWGMRSWRDGIGWKGPNNTITHTNSWQRCGTAVLMVPERNRNETLAFTRYRYTLGMFWTVLACQYEDAAWGTIRKTFSCTVLHYIASCYALHNLPLITAINHHQLHHLYSRVLNTPIPCVKILANCINLKSFAKLSQRKCWQYGLGILAARIREIISTKL